METEVEIINGEKITFVYFQVPMFHEDWHKAEEMGLGYVKYIHNEPDYWDDRMLFVAKDKVEAVRAHIEKSSWY